MKFLKEWNLMAWIYEFDRNGKKSISLLLVNIPCRQPEFEIPVFILSYYQVKIFKSFIFSIISGAAGVVVGQPFDTVKVGQTLCNK